MDSSFQSLLQEWTLRGSVLVSLLLQVILILSGNLRRRSSNKFIVSVLWLTYLFAEYTATFALGIISNTFRHLAPSYTSTDLLGLWAPFLLLHLGGPDTITAFSLEDNQLWLRHAMTLILQGIGVIYILAKSLPGSKLIFSTVLILLAGILKYGERTWALKQGSMNSLRKSLTRKPDPGPDYTQLMAGFSSKLNAGIPAKLDVRSENGDIKVPLLSSSVGIIRHERSMQTLSQAYNFFTIFRKLFVDLFLSFKEANECRSVFRNSSSFEAFQLMEIELSFAYDVLYTKALVIHTPCGRIFRAATFCSTMVAFSVFLVTEKKHYQKTDLAITCLLFAGALALEIVALALFVFSDWTIVMLRKSNKLKWLARISYQVLGIYRRCQWHRWSNCIGQCSLLSYCIKNRKPIACFDKCLTSLDLKEIWNELRYTEYVQISPELKDFIFENLKMKSLLLEDPARYQPFVTNPERYRELSSCRGKWTLEQHKCSELGWSVEVEFDESLLLWHIATDICFHLDNKTGRERPHHNEHRELSRDLSHYLLYLLLVRPFTMSSTSGLGTIRYGDSCAEAMRFFNTEKLVGGEIEACRMLMNEYADIKAMRVKGDISKSVLWDAVRLAKQLWELREKQMWTMVCEVLVEMLYFAARNCRGNFHAQMLSVGGELLTFIWFLEAHLGMGECYKIKSGHILASVVLDIAG